MACPLATCRGSVAFLALLISYLSRGCSAEASTSIAAAAGLLVLGGSPEPQVVDASASSGRMGQRV